MAAIKVPIIKLSPEALQGIIEEFVTRNGTDYGKNEINFETKIRQIKYQLEAGMLVLVFDEETETVNFFSAKDPVLKFLN